jgi:hypothetical protein
MDTWREDRHSQTNNSRDGVVAGVGGPDVARKIDSDAQPALPGSAARLGLLLGWAEGLAKLVP